MASKVKKLSLLGYILHAYAQYFRMIQSARPVTLTFSVTGRCQSRCLTCHIGDWFQEGKFKQKSDLSLQEIEKIFHSLGPIFFFNVSGGEPFLRKDLPEVIDLGVTHLKPAIIHIPTNALTPERIEKACLEILERNRSRGVTIPLTVKPSIDGLDKLHDKIRGVPGNFRKLEETVVRLKILEENYPEFHLELGTVVSRYNVNHLDEIENYVHALGVESYRNEIAEERAEFFNQGEGIAPEAQLYGKVMKRFSDKILAHLPEKRALTKLTETLRLVYYDLAVEILKQKKQVIPCYGGISNLHLNFDGELWPCCVLGYDHTVANLREMNYDVQAALRSEQAKQTLKFIRDRRCYCPLANQWYSNILLHPPTLWRVIFRYFLVDLRRKRS